MTEVKNVLDSSVINTYQHAHRILHRLQSCWGNGPGFEGHLSCPQSCIILSKFPAKVKKLTNTSDPITTITTNGLVACVVACMVWSSVGSKRRKHRKTYRYVVWCAQEDKNLVVHSDWLLVLLMSTWTTCRTIIVVGNPIPALQKPKINECVYFPVFQKVWWGRH
jgi:hypothetical protein